MPRPVRTIQRAVGGHVGLVPGIYGAWAGGFARGRRGRGLVLGGSRPWARISSALDIQYIRAVFVPFVQCKMEQL